MRTRKEIKFNPEQDLWMHSTFGTCVFIGDTKYMYLPYWVKIDVNTGIGSLERLDNLPKELTEYIKKFCYEQEDTKQSER